MSFPSASWSSLVLVSSVSSLPVVEVSVSAVSSGATVPQECYHNEDEEDQVWIELCTALEASVDVEIGKRGTPYLTSETKEMTIDEEETVEIDEQICPLFCIGVSENQTVGVQQTIPILVPFPTTVTVDAVEIEDININTRETRADVHADRACEDMGLSDDCPSIRGGGGSPPDPYQLCNCEILAPADLEATHVADEDSDGEWDGVIVDTTSIEGAGMYVPFEDLDRLI
ncbi:hypothetical protein BRD56_06680 [Thermoplasmatales archaeon SW_10_69_26]|nr:MAG: hypothetical protein BRD56_06680 [Thermoplasmatales archaeon SW_10_69_26]